MYFFLAAFQAKGKYNPPCFVIMKAYVILKTHCWRPLSAALCPAATILIMTISACQAPTAAEVPACRTCMTAPATPFTDIMEEDPFMPTTRSEAPFTPST